LARKILEAVEENVSLTLDRRWFIYGNIYPDISHYSFTVPHLPHKSMAFVLRKIASLCRYHVHGEKADPFYSMQLGMLCHYLCDFFCHVHSQAYSGGKRRHLAYEFRQQAFFMRHPRIIGRKGSASQIAPAYNLPEDAEGIVQNLLTAQEAYHAAPHRPDTDLVLAAKMSAFVVSSIVCICEESARVRAGVLVPQLA
jgi:hypothetical protein